MAWKRVGKYNSRKMIVNGIPFDSRKEGRRYIELRMRELRGEITDLKLQVPFELFPEAREPDTVGPRGGVKHGKVIERKCEYIADFVYKENGVEIVEDTKSEATRKKESYIVKRKAMLYLKGIRIREV